MTYQIDTGHALERTVPDGEDAIATAPPAALEGYTFVGWRQDSSAEKKVLSEYTISGEEPVTLYAVFKKQMTIGLMPNGGTLTVSGAAESFTAFCYYNNGNAQSEPTAAPASPYTRKNMSFCGWSTDSLSTPSYRPGEEGVFPAGATLYAMWVTTEYDFPYTGSYVTFVIPQDGIYEFEVWGGSGGEAKADNLVAEGGLGGHSKGYKKMKKDEVIYIYNGGSASGSSYGANGGASGYNYTSGKQYGAGGGGSTHVGTKSGYLGSTSSSGLSYANRSCVLIVAGGGGGGAINNGVIHKGGDGGGERGGDGSGGALGGRQISTSSSSSTNFGSAQSTGSSSNTCYAGGGGGWFGGNYGTKGESGAGGSGYVDGVAPFTHNGKYYPAETEAGVNKQLAEAQSKLETVERQLETAKVEVTKPFAQEAELAEKLERLSALNALLNMDEKGDEALGMDDTTDIDNVGEEENESRETSGHDVNHSAKQNDLKSGQEEKFSDKPVQRASLKEKLEAFKVKAAGAEKQENHKEKGKEVTM